MSTGFRLGFLYNHEAVHQVRHTAPLAQVLARRNDVAVTILSSTPEQDAEARSILGPMADRTRFEILRPGSVARALGPVLSRIGPFRRIAVLAHNRRKLAQFDALVVPETTTMLLRDWLGVTGPCLIWVPHGAGDRSVGFRRIAGKFDRVLVAGAKVRERMIAEGGVSPEACQVIGYPKFDTLDPAAPVTSLFANDRPTVVYNPHFDPRLSSWFDMGEQVLDWFAGQSRFNLIFAPHVMLFRRRIHASVEHRLIRWRGDVADRFRHLDHMLVDTGSARSTDMTYTRAADIYLGDASSQIYEWIARPRPALFLNPRKLPWHDDANFAHWRLGDVVSDIPGMAGAMDAAFARFPTYSPVQSQAFARTFSVEAEPAAERGARAILDLLHEPGASAP